MELNEVKKIIYDAVCEIQVLSGRTLPTDICDTIVPIGDVDGFDSLNAVEITVQLSEKFNCSIIENPFVAGNKALNLEQIAQQILNKIIKKEKRK